MLGALPQSTCDILALHVWSVYACLPCVIRLLDLLPLQTEEVLSPRNPRRHQLGVASLWGWSMGTLVWGHQDTQA